MVRSEISHELLRKRGLSPVLMLCAIHIPEEHMLQMQKRRERLLVLFFVYIKYMKMNRLTTESDIAV
jgi:hypothetical protein